MSSWSVESAGGSSAELERACCSFADWTVTVERGCVCLDITAEGDAVPAVQSMFASFRK